MFYHQRRLKNGVQTELKIDRKSRDRILRHDKRVDVFLCALM
jgi:hypothetical protein